MISEKQYRYYQRLHQNRLNLVIHIIGSIMFISGNILMLIGALNFIDYSQLLLGLSITVSAIILQAIGHQFEPEQFDGFKGPLDFIKTFYLELMIVFPAFLFSTYFLENWNRK
tara:strand:- start:57 stop:395 length:339 start_codon:yes stop_codon:yes gene_type:complete